MQPLNILRIIGKAGYHARLWLITAFIIISLKPAAFAERDESVFHLKDLVVVATKDPSPVQEIPSSVTALESDTMEKAGIKRIGDAAGYVPNIHLVEFSERVLSQPYFRGVGSGPGNPAVTTYIDGVPQLHGYSANIEFLDVEQIELVRGAQGMLYGRNTVGGVIHILSRSPDLDIWKYAIKAEYGEHNQRHGQFRLSGPLFKDKLGLSLAAGYASRDGFTENDMTGNDIDSREALLGKLQLKWLFSDQWSARLTLFAQRDRDGDYSLCDLEALRADPYRVQRDFEGYLDRDILAPTLAVEYHGDQVDFVSVTGSVRWETEGITDLDYTPFASNTRQQEIRNRQWTQEFQWRSSKDAPIVLTSNMKLAWQAGALFFTQNYSETSINHIEKPFPVSQTSPVAGLKDSGFGAYAQTTISFHEVWDVSLGLRFDHEKKDADLQTFYSPPIVDAITLDTDRHFTEVSPQFSLTRKIAPGKIIYGSISRGYRAGGFNPVSPEGREAYDEETSLHYEAGAKSTWFDDRLRINMAVFHISWNHLQLNLPFRQTYYIDNAGDAESTGAEIDFSAKPSRNWDIFGSIGYVHARFGDGSRSIHTDPYGTNTEIDIGGNHLIFTPDFTAGAGTQYSWDLGHDSRIFIRGEIFGSGRYFYNTFNTQSQGAYWLTNLRAGYGNDNWFIEVWGKNIFDTQYIPVAFEFPNGQSGFVGENGTPRMFGFRTGFKF